MTRLLLYHFVGFAHNGAMENVDGRSGSAAGAQWFSAVAAPCSLCESAMETIILTQCKRGTSTVDTPWGRSRDVSAHPWTPCERRRRLQRSRRDHVRLRCAVTALLTALLRRPYGVPTARMSERRATARTLSMLKVRAVAWRPRSPHGVQRRCYGVAFAL